MRLPTAFVANFLSERYRSGHNGADSKSDGGLTAPRGFESHPLRQFKHLSCLLRVTGYVVFPSRSGRVATFSAAARKRPAHDEIDTAHRQHHAGEGKRRQRLAKHPPCDLRQDLARGRSHPGAGAHRAGGARGHSLGGRGGAGPAPGDRAAEPSTRRSTNIAAIPRDVGALPRRSSLRVWLLLALLAVAGPARVLQRPGLDPLGGHGASAHG